MDLNHNINYFFIFPKYIQKLNPKVVLVEKDNGINGREKFALKIVNKERLKDDYLKRQIKFECSFQGKLNHANIVRLYESIENDASHYFLIDFT
ncbi:MAG: hypothetical protein MHMPM18_004296 [Marteilia pararefringens]